MTLVCGRIRQFRKELKKLTQQTKKTGREHGVSFCNGKKIHMSSSCVGTSCQIKRMPECKGELLGDFHTHPITMQIAPSDSDIGYGFKNDVPFQCVGNALGQVACYDYTKRHWIDVLQKKENIARELRQCARREEARQPMERVPQTESARRAFEAALHRKCIERPLIEYLRKYGAYCEMQL